MVTRRMAALVLGVSLTGAAWAQDAGQAGATAVQAGAQAPPAAETPKLSVGDAAPALRVSSWVSGGPVERLEPGVTHAVVFWSTWCEHCRRAWPKLKELRERHGEKLRVVAVSVWEDTDAQPRVQAYVERLEAPQGFAFAFAGEESEAERAWLGAAGQEAIPCVFLVDGEGRIAWIGNPLQPPGEFELVADGLVAGTYDVAEAAARARRAAEVAAQAKPLVAEFRAAGRERNWARAVELADRLLALDPATFGGLAQWKFRTMITELQDVRGAYDYVRPLTEGMLKDNAEALNSIAWTIVDEPGLEPRDLDLAVKLAERAAELTKRENGLILDTLAVALFQRGEVARAIETQERAVELTRDVEMRAQLTQRLEMFRRARGG